VPTLYIIDIDETLFITDARVRVIDSKGETRVLSPEEYRKYQLGAGEKFDFSDFEDAEMFARTSRPIERMIDRVKTIMGGIEDESYTIFLTARPDQNDRDVFLEVFRKHGIDIDSGHVERAGNIRLDLFGSRKKAVIIDKYLRRGTWDEAVMFDDDERNLLSFLELGPAHPSVRMTAYLAGLDGEITHFESRERKHGKTFRESQGRGGRRVAHDRGR